MTGRVIKDGLGLGILGLAYLLSWPVAIRPLAWQPPADPGLSGIYAGNEALRGIEILHPELAGPAALDRDRKGNLVAGVADGRVLRLQLKDSSSQPLALAPARALSLQWLSDDRILVADEHAGAWALTGGERFRLSAEAEGTPFRYITDIHMTAGRRIYFLEGSTRYGAGETYKEFLESAPNGRLLRYDDLHDTSTVALRDLYFPTSLCSGPDDAYLLIVEMSRYRVLRHWLAGEKAGQTEVFIDALPGFPDGIRWNGRDTFWLSLYGPRSAALDAAASHPWLRRLYARLPAVLQPKPKARAWVLGLNLEGRVIHNLQYAGDDAYAPISSVLEQEGWLYLGNLSAQGLGRIRIPAAQH